jgi:hypothetical protein
VRAPPPPGRLPFNCLPAEYSWELFAGWQVNSSNPLQVDFARITHSWAVQIGDTYLDHNASGDSIWNQTKVDASQNKSEIVEAVRLCHLANASIAINYSPWGDWWNTYGECDTVTSSSLTLNQPTFSRSCRSV